MRSSGSRFGFTAACVLALCALLLGPRHVHAEGARAGLVVVPGAGQAALSTCLVLESGPVSGVELLRIAQREVGTQVSAVGEAVCRIDAIGCDYPASDCFCQCAGARCDYRSYWNWSADGWVYAGRGGSNRLVGDGQMDAWVWGDGRVEPPALSFDDVCPSASAPSDAASVGLASAQQQQDPYPAPSQTTPAASPTEPAYPGPQSTVAPVVPTERSTPPLPTATLLVRQPTTIAPLFPSPGRATATVRPPTPVPLPLATTESVGVPTPPAPTVASLGGADTAGAPTLDTAAIRIREGVARARAAAEQRAANQAVQSRQYGWFVALCCVLLLALAYALTVRRQRAARARTVFRAPTRDDRQPLPGTSEGSGRAESTIPPGSGATLDAMAPSGAGQQDVRPKDGGDG